LFEGCFTGFSTRPGGDCARRVDATNNVVTIRNSLIWMKPTTFSDFPLGNGELFKDDTNGPQWALHNNIIRADQGVLFDELNEVGYGIRRVSRQPGDPNSKLMSCSNNIFVWLGPGDFPPPYDDSNDRTPLQWLKDPTSGKPCFTFTKDVSVWDNAVAAWKAAHGN
jgi:hypothetical protein